MKKIIFIVFMVSFSVMFSAYLPKVRPNLIKPLVGTTPIISCQKPIISSREYTIYKNKSGEPINKKEFEQINRIEQKTLFPMCLQEGQCPIKNEMNILQQKLHNEPNLKNVQAIYVPRTFYDLMILYMIGTGVKVPLTEDLYLNLVALSIIEEKILGEKPLISTNSRTYKKVESYLQTHLPFLVDKDQFTKLYFKNNSLDEHSARRFIRSKLIIKLEIPLHVSTDEKIDLKILTYVDYFIVPLFELPINIAIDVKKINENPAIKNLQNFVNNYIIQFTQEKKINFHDENSFVALLNDRQFFDAISTAFKMRSIFPLDLLNSRELTKIIKEEIKAHKTEKFLLFRGTSAIEEYEPTMCQSLSFGASPFSGYSEILGGAIFYNYYLLNKKAYMLPLNLTSYENMNEMFDVPALVPVASFFGWGVLFHPRSKFESGKGSVSGFGGGFFAPENIASKYQTSPEQSKKVYEYIQKHHIPMGKFETKYIQQHNIPLGELEKKPLYIRIINYIKEQLSTSKSTEHKEIEKTLD